MRDLRALVEMNRGLPLNADGHVVNPLYLPPASPYRAAWRAYCTATDQRAWPPSLANDLARFMKQTP